MSLLEKATIITTPTAHSNGTLHSIKGGAVADFDVVRGSAATGVNAEGLIESVATNIPRIDYTTGEGVVLLEPQSTNLVTYSEDFSSLNERDNAVAISNQVASPSGLLDADEITFDGTLYGRIETSFSTTNGATYTISVYLKNKDLSDVTQVWLGFANIGQGQFVTITDEWQRYDITLAANGTTEYPRIQFSGTGSLYAWGFQAEALPYSTSYIPTSGAIATRLADSVTGAGDVSTFNDSEGVLYFEGSALTNSLDTDGIIRIGNSSEYVDLRYDTSQNRMQMVVRAGGGNQTTSGVAITDTTANNKFALKYKENDFTLWVNGVEEVTDNSGSTPTGLSELSFTNFKGKVKALAVFNEALTDSELECLTTI